MNKLLIAWAIGLSLLGHGAVQAEVETVRLPFGPDAQDVARGLLGAMAGSSGQPPSVRDIAIESFAVRYIIATKESRGAAEVVVSFDAANRTVAVTSEVYVDEARKFAQRIKRELEERTTTKHLRILWPNEGVTEEPASTIARGPPWWQSVDQILTLVLLITLLLGLLASRVRLLHEIRTIGPRDRFFLTLFIGTVAAGLWLSGDAVLYHSGHGWALTELIHHGSTDDLHAGALAPLWSHLLGSPAAPGQEAFFASRVGLLLCALLMWTWLYFMTGQRLVAWVATLLLVAQPSLFLASRSEYVATPGLVFVLLSLNLVTLAGRYRERSMILTAAIALALVASFRAIGQVAWPFCALFFLVSPAVEAKKNLRLAVGAGVFTALCAIPSLMRVFGVGLPYMPEEGMALIPNLGKTQLLGDATWTGPYFGWLTVLAALGLGLSRTASHRYRHRVAVLILFGLTWGIIYATQHVAGTYLNTPRYHVWLLVPAAVVLGGCAALLIERGGRFGRLGCAGGLFLLAFGLASPWSISLERHPESRQLDAWRSAIDTLPEGVTLYVPEFRGEHQIKLPFIELAQARPDIKLKRGGLPTSAETYGFRPLDCMRPALQPAPSARDDCHGFENGWSPVEQATRGTSWRVPAEDGDGHREGSIDADYWVYPALANPPSPVGLFRR